VPDLIYNSSSWSLSAVSFLFSRVLSQRRRKEAGTRECISHDGAHFSHVIAAILPFCPTADETYHPRISADKLQGVAMLTRIMFLSPIFLGISGIFGGILNSFKRFLIYSLAPSCIIWHNFWRSFFGEAFRDCRTRLGVVIGAFLHMVVNIRM